MQHDKDKGFTLVELAFVLLLISLTVALVAKGTELISSAKVKVMMRDLIDVETAINSYQDTYRALPGDDRLASRHLTAPVRNGNGNSIINGPWNSNEGESYALWQHVRVAGLLQGATDTGASDYVPHIPGGGMLGVTNASESPISGLSGSYIVCSNHVSGQQAHLLDLAMDDGNPASGSLRAVEENGGPRPATTLEDRAFYLICLGS